MKMLRDEVRAVLGKSLIGGDSGLLPTVDPQVLLTLAQEEGVVVLLSDAVAAAGGAGIGASWKPVTTRLIAEELARRSEAVRVLGTLARAELPVLVLKGTALAYWLYPKPAQRGRCDFDVLVPDRASALQAVKELQGLGYQWTGADMADSSGFEVALHRRGAGGAFHRIDLHWRLLNNAVLADGWTFDALWNRSIEIPALCPGARGLGAVDALIHAALHRLTNIPYGLQDRLIWLYDIHLLAMGMDANQWHDALQVIGEKGVAAPLLDALSAARGAFETVMPPEVETALQVKARASDWRLRGVFDAGALDRAHLGALSWREKPVWLWRKLLPSPRFMRNRYGAGGTYGLLRAYLGRWWLGIRRASGGPPSSGA